MTERVRLVHITTIPESLGFLRGQLAFMREHGFDVAAISSPGEYLESFATEQAIDHEAVPMARKITPLRDLVALGRLWRSLRARRPTIVHAHTPKAGLLGMLASVLAGVPVRVYHMRGLPLSTATGMRRQLLGWTERIACACAHEVICVSASLRDVAIEENLAPADKLVVLAGGSGNGVDAESKFDPSRLPAETRASTRERYGIPADARVIGFVGRLVRDKGVLELLAAFEQLAATRPDLHLMVVGMEEQRDALPAEAMQLMQSHPRIHWRGHDWNSPPLYAAMDVVALPTYREGFPNVPLETAAMQLPIVASRVPGCVDAVEDSVTGTLVPARDASALATALGAYVDDADLRARHGRAGRARVLLKFQQAVIWRALLDHYRALLGQLAAGELAVGHAS